MKFISTKTGFFKGFSGGFMSKFVRWGSTESGSANTHKFQKLDEGYNLLKKGEYESSAKLFNKWLDEEKILGISHHHPGEGDGVQQKFKEYLPSIVFAFLECPCSDGCKDKVEAIVDKNLDFRDHEGNNIMHIVASSANGKNRTIYDSIMKILRKDGEEDLLSEKNDRKDTPIEVAFSRNNSAFLKSAIENCKKPSLEDFNNMEKLGYYSSLKDCDYVGVKSLLLDHFDSLEHSSEQVLFGKEEDFSQDLLFYRS